MPALHSTPSRVPFPGTAFDVVAVGASAGGIEAMMEILAHLPEELPAAVVLVQHLPPAAKSYLPQVLGRHSPLPVHWAKDGMPLRPGVVFIAPPDHHVLMGDDGRLLLTRTGRVHSVRPSVDVLFTSLAATVKDRAVAVILSGGGENGSAGAKAAQKAGGIVIAQNRASCQLFGMPRAAIEAGCVDYVLPLCEIAPLILRLTSCGRSQGNGCPRGKKTSTESPAQRSARDAVLCAGDLWRTAGAAGAAYRRRTR